MSEVRVTDHAVLRYLERVDGVDVEAVRQRIAEQCTRGGEADAWSVRCGAARFVIVRNVVVSTLHRTMPLNWRIYVRRGRRRGKR